MLRLILSTLVALTIAFVVHNAAQADVTIYVEDFEDEQGNAGFDPRFQHLFYGHSPGSIPLWHLSEKLTPSYPGDFRLFLGSQDMIQFNLSPEQFVVHASVDIRDSGGDSAVCFMGDIGEVTYVYRSGYEYRTFDASSSEIGIIHSILLSSYEGNYDNISITIVPEPNCIASLVAMLLCLAVFFKRFNH
ncbi:MAG: hypothetical protein JXM70_00020 [Pirellulales bacterium]|nr:hypothetical protein [Pirellulales bacterium]